MGGTGGSPQNFLYFNFIYEYFGGYIYIQREVPENGRDVPGHGDGQGVHPDASSTVRCCVRTCVFVGEFAHYMSIRRR